MMESQMTVDVPESIGLLLDLREVRVIDAEKGVYFLCWGDEVVYVGSAIYVSSRVATHAAEGRKQFDRAYFIPVSMSELDHTETQFILQLKPRFNLALGPCSCEGCREISPREYRKNARRRRKLEARARAGRSRFPSRTGSSLDRVYWFTRTEAGDWRRVAPARAVELFVDGETVRLGSLRESYRWAFAKCCECGKPMTDADRGKYRPIFCGPCDEAFERRKNELVSQPPMSGEDQ